ncbi:hypothetical protein PINS_up013044 [Pythium insidiosum]|nr:hypothetical protein PINS_up013044 [Pythium insidiosum]
MPSDALLWKDVIALLNDAGDTDVALPVALQGVDDAPASRASSKSDTTSGGGRGGRDLRRHREAMARYRHEHRARIEDLERQEQRLVLQLRSLLDRLKALDGPEHKHEQRSGRLRELQRLVRVDDSLRRERVALEDRLSKHGRFQRLIAREVDHVPPGAASRESGERLQMNGRWFQFADDELPFYYKPQTDDECLEHVMRSLEGLRHMLHRFAQYPSRVTTTECLGWTTEHSLDREDPSRPVLRYRFTRRARCLHTSIFELQAQAWRLLTDASAVQRMYTTRVVSTLLQTLTDGSVVHLRNVPTKENRTHLRHVTLTKRLTCGEYLRGGQRAAAVLTVVMDSDCCRQLSSASAGGITAGEVLLKDGGWSIRFIDGVDAADPSAVLVDCTGFQQCADAAHAQHVLMEVCAALLRLEHMILAPQLLPH